ncbi:hypothetical protein FA13DRAFT_1716361 [Coprinellus micaceus]|uniref:Uncharacterized protein n=1 Tax=Coprinellus micaceus TaxID=71717 RepID=A0A4Y7SJR1_COPMI|nr:hypothetical protein FA13DRAFT_1716361 [Coprinellus micaceus]
MPYAYTCDDNKNQEDVDEIPREPEGTSRPECFQVTRLQSLRPCPDRECRDLGARAEPPELSHRVIALPRDAPSIIGSAEVVGYDADTVVLGNEGVEWREGPEADEGQSGPRFQTRRSAQAGVTRVIGAGGIWSSERRRLTAGSNQLRARYFCPCTRLPNKTYFVVRTTPISPLCNDALPLRQFLSLPPTHSKTSLAPTFIYSNPKAGAGIARHTPPLFLSPFPPRDPSTRATLGRRLAMPWPGLKEGMLANPNRYNTPAALQIDRQSSPGPRGTARGWQSLEEVGRSAGCSGMHCDDTSVNKLKKWNKHNNWLFTLARLPRREVMKGSNVHFLATSDLAPPLEMLDGIVDWIQCVALCPLPQPFASVGVERGNEMGYGLGRAVMFVPVVLALLGDNSMQSEFMFEKIEKRLSMIPSANGISLGVFNTLQHENPQHRVGQDSVKCEGLREAVVNSVISYGTGKVLPLAVFANKMAEKYCGKGQKPTYASTMVPYPIFGSLTPWQQRFALENNYVLPENEDTKPKRGTKPKTPSDVDDDSEDDPSSFPIAYLSSGYCGIGTTLASERLSAPHRAGPLRGRDTLLISSSRTSGHPGVDELDAVLAPSTQESPADVPMPQASANTYYSFLFDP